MSKVYATAMVAGDLAPEAGSGHASSSLTKRWSRQREREGREFALRLSAERYGRMRGTQLNASR